MVSGRAGENDLMHMCDSESCSKALVLKGLGKWEDFWSMVVDRERKECCFVLELSGDVSNLKREVVVPEGLSRSVQLRFPEGVGGALTLDVILNARSGFGLYVGGRLMSGGRVDLAVHSLQEVEGSHMLFKGRLVVDSRSGLDVETLGVIGGGAKGGRCEYDTRVLQVGEGGEVHGEPHMEILRDDVQADHGYSVGRVPDDVIRYMESRGVGVKDIEKMYADGFLGR